MRSFIKGLGIKVKLRPCAKSPSWIKDKAGEGPQVIWQPDMFIPKCYETCQKLERCIKHSYQNLDVCNAPFKYLGSHRTSVSIYVFFSFSRCLIYSVYKIYQKHIHKNINTFQAFIYIINYVMLSMSYKCYKNSKS